MSRDNVSNQLSDYATSIANQKGTITASNGAPIDSITASLTRFLSDHNMNNIIAISIHF